MKPTVVTLRSPLTGADLESIACIHADAFPESLLTALGHAAILRYYRWLLHGPHKAATVAAEQQARLLGFAFGGRFDGAFSGFVRRNRIFLVTRILLNPAVVTNQELRSRLFSGIRTLARLRSSAPAQQRPTPGRREFTVQVVAVAPPSQNRGLGRLLMTALEEQARAAGYESMQLTVRAANERAVCFYQSIGWVKRSQNSTWRGDMLRELGATEVGAQNRPGVQRSHA